MATFLQWAAVWHLERNQRLGCLMQQGLGVDLPEDMDVRGLAQFFNGVIQGVAVLAGAQQDPEAIQNLIRYAMRAWPGSIP